MNRGSAVVRKDLLLVATPAILAACGTTTGAAPLPPSASATTAPVGDALARLSTAWNTGNGDAWAAEYWPDGSLVNILGVVFATAGAIAAVTNAILAGPFKASSFAYTVRRVRSIGTDAAIADMDVSVTNFRGLPPGAVATAPGLLVTRFTHVFSNRGDVWRIEASHNTAVLPAAVSAQPS